jgi:hypothetical protein
MRTVSILFLASTLAAAQDMPLHDISFRARTGTR